MEHQRLTSEHGTYVIEVCEDCLTIGGKQFPDDCVSLNTQETEEVLQVLLAWKSAQVKPAQAEGAIATAVRIAQERLDRRLEGKEGTSATPILLLADEMTSLFARRGTTVQAQEGV